MRIHRLPNGNVTGIRNDEAPVFAGLRRGRRMTCLRSATPKVFASRSTRQANDERSSNAQTRKATRGRVRTPKALAKQNSLSRISHEVLWSAMRPRIALTCRDHGVRVLMLVLLTIPPISIFGLPIPSNSSIKKSGCKPTAQNEYDKTKHYRQPRESGGPGQLANCREPGSRLSPE